MRITSLILLFLLSSSAFGASVAEVDDRHQHIYTILQTEPDSAMSLAVQTLEMSKDLGYDWGIANSYYIQGYIYQKRNELSAALLMYLKSIQILKQKSDKRSVVNYIQIQMNCGTILRLHSKFEEAITFYDEAIDKAEEADAPKEKLKVMYNKSFAYREMSENELALNLLREVEVMALELNNQDMLVNSIMAMGSIHQKLLEFEKAKYHFRKVLDSPNVEYNVIAIAWLNMGEVFEAQHHFDSAAYCYNQGIDPITKIPIANFKNKRNFETQLALAGLYLKHNFYKRGIHHGEQALELYSKVDLLPEYYKLFKLLADLNFKNGNSTQSYAYMNRYYEENAKFQEHQEEVIRLRDKFRIDILLAGFYGEVERETVTSRYQMVIGFLLIGIVFWIGISRIKFNLFRSQLAKEIRRINQDSIV